MERQCRRYEAFCARVLGVSLQNGWRKMPYMETSTLKRPFVK